MKAKEKLQIRRAQRHLDKARALLGRVTFVDSTLREAMCGVDAIKLISTASIHLNTLLENK